MPTATNIHGTATPGPRSQALTLAAGHDSKVTNSFWFPLQIPSGASNQARSVATVPSSPVPNSFASNPPKRLPIRLQIHPRNFNTPLKIKPVFL